MSLCRCAEIAWSTKILRQNKRFGDFVTEAKYVIVDLVGGVAKLYSNLWQKTEKTDMIRPSLEKRFSTLVLPI
jgi:hypothetical protein